MCLQERGEESVEKLIKRGDELNLRRVRTLSLMKKVMANFL